jgi:hypothetical protein
MIYKFIWNDKREKVKRETMNKNYLEGGLKMIDIDKYIEAIQIINKRLFTMKVENHDTTKLGNQHENLLKREIQRM